MRLLEITERVLHYQQIGNMSEYFDPYSDTEQVPDPEPEDM